MERIFLDYNVSGERVELRSGWKEGVRVRTCSSTGAQ